ncbi:DUF2213 domain-containing protein [Allopontixanthobacter sediminis]|uniref:DUF2213 domain-containing protein n=1 Tax=Allopontixanthobacter sediminis TaxID=1689985 RepID=A0A845AXJ5_9SPHN|nr:DUF2213 domain-containing protein [Allopontixanthobacter sediminis]MXP42975.1 DUF2213 domain-containing protein [Allopontixanthobacter sediminis]
MVQLCDTLTFDKSARICADGSLVAEVFAARTGLQDYLSSEVDPEGTRDFKPGQMVKVYRPESEVFKADSLATFAAAPVTINHPSEAVTADNWRGLGVGEINGDVVRDGQRVRVPIIVRDAGAVKAATTTHKQLSMGYATELVFPTDGKHPDGTVCDAYQTNLRINHIALVPAGRGGPELRVVDERTPIQNKEKSMKKIVLDGLQVDLSDADAVAAAFSKLQGQITDANDAKSKAETDLATAVTDKANLEAKVTTLEKQVADAKLTPAQLRDAAKAYSQTVDKAKALGVTVSDEMDEGAIMQAAVSAKIGDAAKDWTGAQVAASFATLTADAKSLVHNLDPARPINDAARETKALADSINNLNAWRNPANAAA